MTMQLAALVNGIGFGNKVELLFHHYKLQQISRNKGGSIMLWKCDICSTTIDLSDAIQLTNGEVLTNKGYWRFAFRNPQVNEDTLAQYIMNLYNSSGGYKICNSCNSMLNNNKEYPQSTVVDAYTVAKIAGGVWEEKYGKWPNSVRFGTPSNQNNSSDKKSGCFIATACYGSANCIEVIEFRRFRDEILLDNWLGKQFVSVYYSVSPPIAALLHRSPFLRLFVKRYILKPLFGALRRR